MNHLVSDAIKKFYEQGDHTEYLLKCKSKIVLPSELISYVSEKTFNVENHSASEVWPSSTWAFHQHAYRKGELNVMYSSLLTVSKLAPLYYLHHEFQVENRDENRMSPTLDGFDTQPYTQIQAELQIIIDESFKQWGYEKLSYREMNVVLHGIHFPKDVQLWGPQVTVEYALFHDVLEICPD